MKYFLKSGLLLPCLLAVVISSGAAPLDRSTVIADPAWVAHLDVDALRKTVVGGQILAEMSKPEANLRFAALTAAVGTDLRTLLHGVTVYGISSKPEDGVALIHAEVNSERLMALARQAEDYQASTNGQHQIASWVDAKRREKEGGTPRTYASIYQNRTVIFGQREARLREVLDVLDKTKPCLAKDVFPKLGADESAIIQGAARRMDAPEGDPRAAILKLAQLADLDVREAEGKVKATLSLETKNEESAQQAANIARGIIAVISLQTGNSDAVNLAKSLSVDQTAEKATVRLSLPVDDVVTAMKAHASKDGAKEAEKKTDGQNEAK